jgi:hypothetical protein
MTLKDRAKCLLESFPRLYLEILRVKRRGHWSREWVVSRDTEIVIEGFPRSANSFARSAFRSCQPNVRYATHVHSSAQIVQASRWGIPTLVVLRDPEGAVCGDLAFQCELDGSDPDKVTAQSLNASLYRYIKFYRPLASLKPHFVVGHFPEVIADYGAVIRRINEKFGTAFVVFQHTEKNAADIKSRAAHIGPNVNRERIKSVVRRKYLKEADLSLKTSAHEVYLSVLGAVG